MKKMTLGGVMALLCLQVTAQPIATTALNMGDPVPDLLLRNMYNYASPSASISEFKDKLILLDFFATWCGSCIKELPELERLQQKYKDQIQVIVVATDTARDNPVKMNAFFEKWKQQTGRMFRLTYLYAKDNPLLKTWFPHRMLPHNVWISPEGRVLYITDQSYINEAFVEKALRKQPMQIVSKKDLQGIKKYQPLSIGQTRDVENEVAYRAAFYKYMGLGAGTSIIKDTTSRTVTHRWLNYSLLQLLQEALPPLATGFGRSYRLDVKDSTRFIRGHLPIAAWSQQHCYTYETTFPDTVSEEQVRQWMLEDISRFFRLKVFTQQQLTTVWELLLLDSTKLLSARATEKDSMNISTGYIRLSSGSMQKLHAFLKNYTTSSPMVPIIDRTGFTKPIAVELLIPPEITLSALQRLLLPFGLGVRAAQESLPVYLITDY